MLTEGTQLVASEVRSGARFGFRRHAVDSVGRLGGPAPLTPGAEWPTWEGHGPMAHIATLNCQQLHQHLPVALRGAGFPQHGSLSFFYFDGQVDGGVEVVGALFGNNAGARVIYTPSDSEVVLTEPPAPVSPYPGVEIRAEPILTWPIWEHPDLFDGARPADGWDALFETLDAVRQERPAPLHQVGGHPDPVQGPVEIEIAYGFQSEGGRNTVEWNDPAVLAQSREWMLLAQFDTDDQAGFMWGDAGVLYYMIRPVDLASGAFERVGFTWQCA
jgi:uncharacterized protein YwqG